MSQASQLLLTDILVECDEIAWHKLEDQVGVRVVSKHVKQFYYVGVRHSLQDLGFPLEHHLYLGTRVFDLLDGHLLMSESVHGLQDHAVGSLSNLPAHLEPVRPYLPAHLEPVHAE